MKKYSSDLYGEILEPESFDEMLALITKDNAIIGKHTIRMWRGQSNINWRVDHSAYRRLKNTIAAPSEIDITLYEKRLLEQATHKGYRYQEGRDLCDLELLAKLQHNGAATRLLDFSRSALIALWFAVNENFEENGLLFGVHSSSLGGYEAQLNTSPYAELTNNLKEYDHPITWEPPAISPRIASQHSQFLYSHTSNQKTGSLMLTDTENHNLFIAINKSIKQEVLQLLSDVFDIREFTLFPDISGFSGVFSHRNPMYNTLRW